MFNPFVWLDGVLLAAAQKFCDKFQRVTGLTKFRLQKWSLIFTLILGWGLIVFGPMIIPSVLMHTLVLGGNIWMDDRDEAAFLAKNTLAISPANFTLVRIIGSCCLGGLGICVLLFVPEFRIFLYGELLFLFIYLYFSACIPRPPGRSKMREWYNKTLWAVNDWLKPAPVPASN